MTKESSERLILDVHVENEQVVLAAVILDPGTFRREVPGLRLEWFNSPNHRDIVRTLRQILRGGGAYAADTVVHLSNGAVKLEYLRGLEDKFSPLPAENFSMHLGILKRDSAKFAANTPFTALYGDLDDPHATPEEAAGHALDVLRCLRGGIAGEARVRRGRALREEWFSDLSDVRTGKDVNFVPTHFSELDAFLYEGLRPGRVVVVAGRPGMGKSTFCSNLTRRLGNHGRRVLSVPVEAGTMSVVEQMACARAQVAAEKVIKTPHLLTDLEMMSLRAAAKLILDSEYLVFDDEVANLDELELRVEEENFDVVILDLFEYLIQGEVDAARVTEDLRRLKKLAKRRRFAAVVVQQIRRIKRVKNPRPQLHELKNSGGYEEVADLVLLLHRSKYYDPDSEDSDVLEIKVAKQRRGPQNVTVGYEFEPEICRVGKFTTDHSGGRG